MAGAGAPFTRRSATRHLPVARRPAHRGHHPGDRESPRRGRRRACPVLGVGVHPLPVRLDRGRPVLRPLRVPHRPAAPAGARANRIRSTFRASSSGAGCASGRSISPGSRFSRSHSGSGGGLAGRHVSLELRPGTGQRRMVALHRGTVLPGRPAATARRSARFRAEGTGLGAARAARADAGRPRGVAPRRGWAGLERIHGPIHTHCDGLLVGLFLAWASVKRPETLSPENPRPWRWPLVAIVAGFGLRAIDAPLFSFSGLGLVYGGRWPSGSGPGRGFDSSPRGGGFTSCRGCRSGCTSTTSRCCPGCCPG